LLAAGFSVGASVVAVEAKAPAANNPTVRVEGPLASISSTPLVLTPAFDPWISDFVLRCQAGINIVQFTLSASSDRRLNVAGNNAHTITLQVSLLENQALILDSHGSNVPGGAHYWIRCLPHDFPQLTVNRPGNPPAGWYLTGNLNTAFGAGTYAMVLDKYGIPVWYRKTAKPGALDVTPLSGDRIAWMAFSAAFGSDPIGAFEVFDLDTHATQWLAAPIPPTDPHELVELANGNLLLLSSPLRRNIDMSVFGNGIQTIVDCVIQEVNPAGALIWQWRASDHISVSEATRTPVAVVRGELVYDLLHCNSIDSDPISGNLLLSARHTDAVYLIDRTTGEVEWKIGGRGVNPDGAVSLQVVGDPEGTFHAQHDARFQPGRGISLYDDQSWDSGLAARGVEYRIDPIARTATLVWAYESPDGRNSAATGSFRRLDGGADNIIGWGLKPNALFTEVDAFGNVMLDVRFSGSQAAYRVVKVPTASFNHDLLRNSAGLLPTIPLV
jgi:hypothetical protein